MILIKSANKLKMTNKFWDNYKYPLNEESLINQKIINESIDNFWLKVIKKVKPNNHLFILFRVKTSDHYLTLGYLQKINLNDKEYFKNYILDIFSIFLLYILIFFFTIYYFYFYI